MRLFLVFLAWPLAEITLFVTLGGRIGLAATLLVILSSAILGVWVLRSCGIRSAQEMQRGMRSMGGGLGQVADRVLLMLAGLLLILPGFLTDIMGGLLLIGPLRRALVQWAGHRLSADRPGRGQTEPFDMARRPGDIVIDGEFIEVEPDPRHPRSGWTRH